VSEYPALFFSEAILRQMRAECHELLDEGVRDFVTVVQHLIGRCGLSLYDVRMEVEGCYNSVREERIAAGQDVSGMTSPSGVAEAAAWLQRWISHPSHLASPRDRGWGGGT
jgi:hypothetical protein